ncbi:AT-rich interactive domain-containing protein 4B [Lingula anatina]|uniref:AT-rich interactive domain-containing protein 4B n=1 Tax=Lingula anatina TaxID=7574 RepID=A0A1S3J2K4_LINAN|nr:AT-rich interactive domain-containing protein 4B [Lingula anatina]|eukprot:XP_013404516.1 AT-rich interactive domain-containing protein 4B [Lingula anatina]
MAASEPPYLPVGTEVSAKYRGAYCEAKINKVTRCVKCKISVKDSSALMFVSDDAVKGPLKVGAAVEVKQPDSEQHVEGTILSMKDSSTYHVVFDDGDQATLRRTQLCLKGEKHFIESETLDQLPLTHPEHFGTPVMNSKKNRKGRSQKGDETESESEEESPSKRPATKPKSDDWVGKVVCIESGDKKKPSWFPALVVKPGAHNTELKGRTQILVRSFKDNKFSAVTKKDAKDFTSSLVTKNEDKSLKVALEKAQLYLDKRELPQSWDKDALVGSDSESEESSEESSDDEPSEEKDRFVAQLYKFMDDRGTPINKAPCLGSKDLSLYKLFKVVQNYGGYNKVTSQLKWRLIYSKMGLPPSNSASSQIQQAYKRYLHAFEDFYRKLGSSMGTISRPSRSRNSSGRGGFLSFSERERETPRSPKRDDKTSSDDEPSEEKDRFVAQLYKFMDDRGTPINKAPCLGSKDLSLYKLFKVVQNYGGYNKVTSQLKWRLIYSKMGLPPSNSASSQIQQAYKRYLHAFEDFYRKLGSSMGTISRPSRSRNSSGRGGFLSFRERERETPRSPKRDDKTNVKDQDKMKAKDINFEKTPVKETDAEKQKEKAQPIVKKADKEEKEESEVPRKETRGRRLSKAVEAEEDSPKKRISRSDSRAQIENKKTEPDDKRSTRSDKQEPAEKKKDEKKTPVTKSESKFTKPEPRPDSPRRGRPRLLDKKSPKTSKTDTESDADSVKTDIDKDEEKDEVREKRGRRKSSRLDDEDSKDGKEEESSNTRSKKTAEEKSKKAETESKKNEEKTSKVKKEAEDECESSGKNDDPSILFPIGTRVKVKYGKGKNQKVYEAKVTDVDKEDSQRIYCVHYSGWNIRYDEWIKKERLVCAVEKKDGKKNPPKPASVERSSPKPSRSDSPITSATPPGSASPASGQSSSLSKKRGRPGAVGNDRPDRHTSPAATSTTEARMSRSRSPASAGVKAPRPTRSTSIDNPLVDGLPPRRRGRRSSGYTESSEQLSLVSGEEDGNISDEDEREEISTTNKATIKSSLPTQEDPVEDKYKFDEVDEATIKIEPLQHVPKRVEPNKAKIEILEPSKVKEKKHEEMPTVPMKAKDAKAINIHKESETAVISGPEQQKKILPEEKTRSHQQIISTKSEEKDVEESQIKTRDRSPSKVSTELKVDAMETDAAKPEKKETKAKGKRKEPETDKSMKPTTKRRRTSSESKKEDPREEEATAVKPSVIKEELENNEQKFEESAKSSEEDQGGKSDTSNKSDKKKKKDTKTKEDKPKTEQDISKKDKTQKTIKTEKTEFVTQQTQENEEEKSTKKKGKKKKAKQDTEEKVKAEENKVTEKAETVAISESKDVINSAENDRLAVATLLAQALPVEHNKVEWTNTEPNSPKPSTSGTLQALSNAAAGVASAYSPAAAVPSRVRAETPEKVSAPNVLLENTPPITPEGSPRGEHGVGESQLNKNRNLPQAEESMDTLDGEGSAITKGSESPHSSIGSNEAGGSSDNITGSETSVEPTGSKRKHVSEETTSSKKRKRSKRQAAKAKQAASDSDEAVTTESVALTSPTSSTGSSIRASPTKRTETAGRRPRSPNRPSKYNFNLEVGADLEGESRINFLQEKLQEIRKIYMSLKSEVASIDRKRKKLKRREKEAHDKQEQQENPEPVSSSQGTQQQVQKEQEQINLNETLCS